MVAGFAILAVLGLAIGGGDPNHLFGADWSQVAWPDVIGMLVFVGLAALIILPIAHFVLPSRYKRVGTAFAAVSIIAPLGLIAPGFAYGEGSTQDIEQAFGYVPKGLQDLSSIFSAPLSGYDLPFLQGANESLLRSAIVTSHRWDRGHPPVRHLCHRNRQLAPPRATGRPRRGCHSPRAVSNVTMSAAPDPVGQSAVATTVPAKKHGRLGWLEHTLAGIAELIERAVFTEEHARAPGWLQRVDPRAKLGAFLALVLAASLSSWLPILIGLYAVTLCAALASRVPTDFFVKRVWMGIPFFAGIVVIPAIFFVPGPRLFEFALGPLVIAPSIPGIETAVVFVARVGVCVSLAVLLVLTTPWADLLKSLHSLRVPQVFILILSMSYRYIFLFLHTTNGLFEARRSRIVAQTSGREQRRWIAGSMGALTSRAFKMSNDVYAAMLARGFTGEMRAYNEYHLRPADLRFSREQSRSAWSHS